MRFQAEAAANPASIRLLLPKEEVFTLHLWFRLPLVVVNDLGK